MYPHPDVTMLFSCPGLRDNARNIPVSSPLSVTRVRPPDSGCGLYSVSRAASSYPTKSLNLRSEIARESLCTLHKGPLHIAHQVQGKPHE